MKLAITLRYLSSGDSYAFLHYEFSVTRNTISLLVKKPVLELKNDIITCTVDRGPWQQVAEEFEKHWNLPHAWMEICSHQKAYQDWNHAPQLQWLLFNRPNGCGRYWLQIHVVGGFGSQSVWCADLQPFRTERMPREWIHWTPSIFPFDKWCLGLSLFPTGRWCFWPPYSGRHMTREDMIASYRISRARHLVENAFGIIVWRWRWRLSTMQQVLTTAPTTVEACVCLHNFIHLWNQDIQNIHMNDEDPTHNHIPGSWRQDANLLELDVPQGGNRDTIIAKRQRDYLRAYFNRPQDVYHGRVGCLKDEFLVWL